SITLHMFYIFLYIHLHSFHHSALHLDLLSFPTRRSSDLSRLLPRREREGKALFKVGDLPHGDGVLVDARLLPVPLDELERREQRDRKSTRLNSSHVSISYAVFCLKKKKII